MEELKEWLSNLDEVLVDNKWMAVKMRGASVTDYYYFGPKTGWNVKVPVGGKISDATVHYIEDASSFKAKYKESLHDSAVVADQTANELNSAIKGQVRAQTIKSKLSRVDK